MIWVIVLVALVMVGILVYILTNQDTPQQPQPTKQATAVITPSPTPTEEATNEKARSTRTPEQAPKPDKKHPSIQARPAQTNDDSSSLNNTPQQQKITETTTEETEQEPSEDDAQNATDPESDETDKENGADEKSTEEEEEEKPLQLGADTDASWIEQYNNLVESKLKEALACPLLGSVENYILEKGYFYDTNFHLNASGALAFTNRIASLLKKTLGMQETTSIEIPKAPPLASDVVVDIPVSGGDLVPFEKYNGSSHKGQRSSPILCRLQAEAHR